MKTYSQEPVIGKIFTSGHSQALRLPKAVCFSKEVREVEIIRQGEELLLRPRKKQMTQKQWREHWERFFSTHEPLFLPERDEEEFMKERPLNTPFKPRDL